MNQTPWQQIQHKLQNPDIEDEVLNNWLTEDQENKTIFDDLKVIYSISGDVSESFVAQRDHAWKNIQQRISEPKPSISITRILLQIAASFLLIALGVGGSLFFQPKNTNITFTEVFSPYGHKTMVVLPDSSQVWLNGNSRIKYCTDFSQTRNVELSGEALFKVIKNPNRKFTVKSQNLRLEVYGTTFNLKSYPEDIVSEVALVEGSVGLFLNQQLIKKMIPGEVINYNKDENKFRTCQDDINQITSWREDELIIENETFENIAKYLGRWYGVEITLDKSLNLNSKLSFKVKTESLMELLSIVNHITPISYEINGKQVKIAKKITNNYRQ